MGLQAVRTVVHAGTPPAPSRPCRPSLPGPQLPAMERGARPVRMGRATRVKRGQAAPTAGSISARGALHLPAGCRTPRDAGPALPTPNRRALGGRIEPTQGEGARSESGRGGGGHAGADARALTARCGRRGWRPSQRVRSPPSPASRSNATQWSIGRGGGEGERGIDGANKGGSQSFAGASALPGGKGRERPPSPSRGRPTSRALEGGVSPNQSQRKWGDAPQKTGTGGVGLEKVESCERRAGVVFFALPAAEENEPKSIIFSEPTLFFDPNLARGGWGGPSRQR